MNAKRETLNATRAIIGETINNKVVSN